MLGDYMIYFCCVYVVISKSDCYGNYKENKVRVLIIIIYNFFIFCEGVIMLNVYVKCFKDII